MMIRKLQVLAIAILMSSVAMGSRSVRVCLSDGNTPLDPVDPCVPWVYQDIMVGTQLTIIVHSNEGGLWGYGDLSIWGTDRDYGELHCKGIDCEDSILPSAGDNAVVQEFYEDEVWGVSFWIDEGAVAGDWFIVDYNATSVGSCQVAFYDWDVGDEPLCEMSFTHVPTRDFNGDHIVNFMDFSVFGSYWGITDCTDPNGCGKVDFYDDDIVDINDLELFVDFWLERTD